VFRKRNRWLREPPLGKILLKEFFMVKKTFVVGMLTILLALGLAGCENKYCGKNGDCYARPNDNYNTGTTGLSACGDNNCGAVKAFNRGEAGSCNCL
jgi:hypothetical protein